MTFHFRQSDFFPMKMNKLRYERKITKENHERHLKLSDVPWRILRNIYKENRGNIHLSVFILFLFCDLFFATSCDLFRKNLFSLPQLWENFFNSSRLLTNRWSWVSRRETSLKTNLKLLLITKVWSPFDRVFMIARSIKKGLKKSILECRVSVAQGKVRLEQ